MVFADHADLTVEGLDVGGRGGRGGEGKACEDFLLLCFEFLGNF